MIRACHYKEIVLPTGPKALTLGDLAETINDVVCQKKSAKDDEGGKPEWWSGKRTSWYDGVAKGDGSRWTH